MGENIEDNRFTICCETCIYCKFSPGNILFNNPCRSTVYLWGEKRRMLVRISFQGQQNIFPFGVRRNHVHPCTEEADCRFDDEGLRNTPDIQSIKVFCCYFTEEKVRKERPEETTECRLILEQGNGFGKSGKRQIFCNPLKSMFRITVEFLFRVLLHQGNTCRIIHECSLIRKILVLCHLISEHRQTSGDDGFFQVTGYIGFIEYDHIQVTAPVSGSTAYVSHTGKMVPEAGIKGRCQPEITLSDTRRRNRTYAPD